MDDFIFVKGKAGQSLDMITARLKSGLSIREWCELHGITSGTYDYHASKLRKLGIYPDSESGRSGNQETAVLLPESAPAFAEVPMPAGIIRGEEKPEADILVEYGSFKISVFRNASRELIKDVLEVASCVH